MSPYLSNFHCCCCILIWWPLSTEASSRAKLGNCVNSIWIFTDVGITTRSNIKLGGRFYPKHSWLIEKDLLCDVFLSVFFWPIYHGSWLLSVSRVKKISSIYLKEFKKLCKCSCPWLDHWVLSLWDVCKNNRAVWQWGFFADVCKQSWEYAWVGEATLETDDGPSWGLNCCFPLVLVVPPPYTVATSFYWWLVTSPKYSQVVLPI